MKIKDRFDNASNIMKFIITLSVFLTVLGTAGSGCYGAFKYFGKQQDIDTLTVRLDKKDLEERISFLEKQIYNCKDRFGDDFSKAIDPWDKENCRKWLDELKKKYKEYDNYYKG